MDLPGEQCPHQRSNVLTRRVPSSPIEPCPHQESSVPTRTSVSSPGEPYAHEDIRVPARKTDVPPGSQPGSWPCSGARLLQPVRDPPSSATEPGGFAGTAEDFHRVGKTKPVSCTSAPISCTGRVLLSECATASFPLRSRFSHFTSFLHPIYSPLFFSFLLSAGSFLLALQRRVALKAWRPRCPAAAAPLLASPAQLGTRR